MNLNSLLLRPLAAGALLAFLFLAMQPLQSEAQADSALAAYDKEDYDTAARLYRPRAQQGDAEAQYRLGLMLRFGWGVDKDLVAAAAMLQAAAEQGQHAAQAELGTMYRLGRGVPEDHALAARWLLAAAAGGVGIAQLAIGRMYRDGMGVPKDLVQAYAWFQSAGENNVMDGFAFRGEIAAEMSEQQIAAAKKLAATRSRTETKEK